MSAAEIRSRITDQILAALNDPAKLPPWRKSWSGDPNSGHPCNAVSRRRYTGINPLLLEIAAHRHGLRSKWWGTFRQWEGLGGRVKKRPADVPPGQFGTSIVFCKPVSKKTTADTGEECEGKFFVLRTYTVFNLDQVDGPFDHLRVGNAPLPVHEIEKRHEHADSVIEEEYGLLSPLLQRLRLILRFDFYGVEDLTTLVLQRSRALGWSVHEELLPQIAQRSRGTPRLALRLLQSCRRVCRSEGEQTINMGHLLRACELEQIDEIGLGPSEQQYLRAVADGASRLNVIGSLLGLPARSVAQVIEPFLLRSGLLVKDDNGRRELTSKAREHQSNRPNNSV